MDTSKRTAEPKDDSDAPFPELLGFCSRAQTLIAELLLLSGRVPPEFRDKRFDPVLFDLRYFDSPNEFELRIDGNAELEALEDELRESCAVYLKRFFVFVNCAVVYHMELQKYLNDLQEGVYVQCTLDKVLESKSGLQLLAESMALFGCLLLFMEYYMNGLLREKFLVAYVRYDRCFRSPNLDHVCFFCRAHLPTLGPICHGSKLPASSSMIYVHKPEDLFSRFPFPKMVVDASISRIRDGDLYNKVHHYPDPQHRTTALSLQAGCLCVLLFFSPELLHNGFVMREIVDRFFKDYWVVPIYLHFSVDLSVLWDVYREAKASLSSCISPTCIRDWSQLHCSKVTDVLSQLNSILTDHVLTEDYVLNNSQHLLSLIRNCNITLRWLLLHRMSMDKKLRDIVNSAGVAWQVNEESLLLLTLKSSQLEFEVKQLYAELLARREGLWQEKKNQASDCLEELSRHCSGLWASSCKIKNESLNDCLGKLVTEVHSLDCTRTGSSGKIIYRVISALREVEEFHQIEESLQIKQLVSEAQKYLQDMIKVLNLDKDAMSTFSEISDAVYAWGYISRFSELLSRNIEQDPSVMLTMHMFFLKFQFFLNLPVLRIAQNESADLFCVSNYFSSEFAAQICATLANIPMMLLRVFSKGGLQSGEPFHLLSHIDKDNLQEFMQLDRQINLLGAANKVCILSKGMLIMSQNLLGLIHLDLKKWLEQKMRKELLAHLNSILNSSLSQSIVEPVSLETSLRKASVYILLQSHMMESFQDLLHIHGNRIWEEILAEVLLQCAQKEHAGIMDRNQQLLISASHLNNLPKAQTFFGHLLHQVLKLTNPSRSMFIEPICGWFDAEGHELLGLHFFDLLDSCVGQVGLVSFDSLMKVLIEENLKHALRVFRKLLDERCLEELHKMDDSLGPATSLLLLRWLSDKQMVKTVNGAWDLWVETISFIGQLQLLRILVALKLKSACKIKAHSIYFAAEAMIMTIHSQRERILKTIESKGEKDATVGLFLQALNKQQELSGFFSPLQTIYISEDPPACLGRFASIFSILQLSRYALDGHLGTFTSRSTKTTIDFPPVVIGLGTFLKQFHTSHMTQYLEYMGQYLQTTAESEFEALHEPQTGNTKSSSEVRKSAFWLMCFCKYMGISKDQADSCLPTSLIATFQI